MAAEYTVKREGPWFKTLAETVARATRGDVIRVPDTEMQAFAIFGLSARRISSTDPKDGIVVHLIEGASPAVVEKATRRSAEITIHPLGSMFTEAQRQTAITITAEGIAGETLLVPPDLYDAGQKFLCQQCGQEYVYGLAKAKMEFNALKNAVLESYHPLVFCCMSHEDEYLRKHRRYPAVGAEILLSPPERCNLLDHYRRSEGRGIDGNTGRPVGSVVTESYTTPADAMSVDKIAGLLGFEIAGPTVVVEQKVADVKPRGAQET